MKPKQFEMKGFSGSRRSFERDLRRDMPIWIVTGRSESGGRWDKAMRVHQATRTSFSVRKGSLTPASASSSRAVA